jgi:hypothetical protein
MRLQKRPPWPQKLNYVNQTKKEGKEASEAAQEVAREGRKKAYTK